MAFASSALRPVATASWSPWSAMPPRFRPGSGLRPPATGSTTAPNGQQFKARFLKTPGPTTVYLLWRCHCEKLTAFRSAARKSQPSGKTPAGLRTGAPDAAARGRVPGISPLGPRVGRHDAKAILGVLVSDTLDQAGEHLVIAPVLFPKSVYYVDTGR